MVSEQPALAAEATGTVVAALFNMSMKKLQVAVHKPLVHVGTRVDQLPYCC